MEDSYLREAGHTQTKRAAPKGGEGGAGGGDRLSNLKGMCPLKPAHLHIRNEPLRPPNHELLEPPLLNNLAQHYELHNTARAKHLPT